MDWTQVVTMIGSNAALFLCVIGVNVALMSWLKSDIKSFEGEIRGWKDEISKQMTDFHGRLCALDERTKK